MLVNVWWRYIPEHLGVAYFAESEHNGSRLVGRADLGDLHIMAGGDVWARAQRTAVDQAINEVLEQIFARGWRILAEPLGLKTLTEEA